MSHSVAKTRRSGHSVKRDAAAMNHIRKIMCFLTVKVCKSVLLGLTNKSINMKISII